MMEVIKVIRKMAGPGLWVFRRAWLSRADHSLRRLEPLTQTKSDEKSNLRNGVHSTGSSVGCGIYGRAIFQIRVIRVNLRQKDSTPPIS